MLVVLHILILKKILLQCTSEYVLIALTSDLENILSGNNKEVEILNKSGKKLLMITESTFSKVVTIFTTYYTAYQEYNSTFEYNYIEYSELSEEERMVLIIKIKIKIK